MEALLRLPLFVIFLIALSLFADAPDTKALVAPKLSQKADTSRSETTPWIKKIDITHTSGIIRVIVKASAATECYKQREIERIFEKDVVKIVLRLKRPHDGKECTNTKLFDYEEKIYESSPELAPARIWVLGYEGWHKLEVH
ncbi:MAG: hypothetical protein R3A80_05350 [Bdellovibrionota bacterium]